MREEHKLTVLWQVTRKMFISKKKPPEIVIVRNDKLCDSSKSTLVLGEWNLKG